MSCVKNDKIRHNPDIIASTIIEMICNDLKFHDMQNDTEYLLLQSVLKEQKKIQAEQEKRLTRISNNKKRNMVKVPTKKISKFKEKYKERIESIQNTDAKTAENKRIAEEIEKMENNKRNEQGQTLTSDPYRTYPARRNHKNKTK
jgi:hypothetical protein